MLLVHEGFVESVIEPDKERFSATLVGSPTQSQGTCSGKIIDILIYVPYLVLTKVFRGKLSGITTKV